MSRFIRRRKKNKPSSTPTAPEPAVAPAPEPDVAPAPEPAIAPAPEPAVAPTPGDTGVPAQVDDAAADENQEKSMKNASDSKDGDLSGNNNIENKPFKNKQVEQTTKVLNKVNFSRPRQLADKFGEQIVDSAARYGNTISLDTIKDKLGADLFRNLKQTSLKLFFDFVSKFSNSSVEVVNSVFKAASIDLEEDGLAGVLSGKNRMRGNILLIFLLDRLNYALTNEKTRKKFNETADLLKQFTNETFTAVLVTLQENKQLLEDTMENFRPIIKNFVVTIVSAALQGLIVAVATSGPLGAPANLWFQGSKVVNELAPRLGIFTKNVGNIIDKYDDMLSKLSKKGERPLARFKEIKDNIDSFTDILLGAKHDAALIESMGKSV